MRSGDIARGPSLTGQKGEGGSHWSSLNEDPVWRALYGAPCPVNKMTDTCKRLLPHPPDAGSKKVGGGY